MRPPTLLDPPEPQHRAATRSVRAAAIGLALAVACAGAACGGRTIRAASNGTSPPNLAELWVGPDDLESRDLFHGPGGSALAPSAAVYTVTTLDDTGYSPGYEVRDAEGTQWSVKLGPEAQTEVVASRVLWAIGFHQPATYLLDTWTLTGKEASKAPDAEGPGRFRREPASETVVSEWSWYENPFVHTTAFKGLLVVNLLLNNWDWKTSDNKVYEITEEDGTARRRYVVRDLGASLGKTSFPALLRPTPFRQLPQGSRNDLDDFEEQGFIEGVEDGRVRFDYSGLHDRLVATIAVEDVLWACDLLARISDAQWHDAFRAGGYSDDEQKRYVGRIKVKIQQGLGLRG